jgi:hypothetical protein
MHTEFYNKVECSVILPTKDTPMASSTCFTIPAPISFILEQAGGMATTGTQRVMEIQLEYVHQCVPLIMGSKSDVQEVLDAYAFQPSE